MAVFPADLDRTETPGEYAKLASSKSAQGQFHSGYFIHEGQRLTLAGDEPPRQVGPSSVHPVVAVIAILTAPVWLLLFVAIVFNLAL